MARLPDSSAFGARPEPRPSRDVIQLRPDPTGPAMQQLGQTIAQVGEEIGRKEDETAVFEARRKLDEWERKTIYDPERGVVAKRGADALELPKTIPGEFDKFAGEVGASLTTNRQRQIFRDMAQARRNQVADFTVRHATTQKEVYEKGMLNADIASSSDRAVALASNGDTNGAKAEIETAALRLTSFMTKRGASGEEIANALKQTSSKTHAQVVSSMVAKGDPSGAKAYLDANSGAMMQDDILRVSGALKEGILRTKAQGFADDVIDKQGLSLEASLKLAREQLTGDEEVAATNEIKTRFAEKEAVRAQSVKQLSTEGWSVVVERGTKGLTPNLVSRLQTEAPEELRQMRDWEQAKWRQAKADAEGKDQDPATYYGLRMMAAENPEAFGKLDLLKSQPMMSKQHYNHLVELQAGISKGDLKAMESQRVMKSTIQMLKNEVAAAGIDLTLTEKDKGTKKAKDTTMFLGALGAALDEATVSKGKPLTTEEARRIGMGLLREGIEQGSGVFLGLGYVGTNKKRGFEIATDPNIKPGTNFIAARYGDIPQSVRNALLSELYPNGVPRTPYGSEAVPEDAQAQIERAYTRGVQQGRFK